MMVVVFAILIVKKRSRKSNRLNNHYLEVAVDAPELSPEDRHIAAMQVRARIVNSDEHPDPEKVVVFAQFDSIRQIQQTALTELICIKTTSVSSSNQF